MSVSDAITIGYDGKEFHTGYSRIQKYMTCPKQYKYVYIDGHRGESSVPMKRGNAYHSALEAALQFKIDKGRQMSSKKVLELGDYFAEQLNLTEAVRNQTRQAIEFWHTMLYPEIDPLFVEESFKIVRGGVTYTGRLDLGTTQGIAGDHKFSYDLWSDDRAKNSVQPVIYQWAWEDIYAERYGVNYRRFEYHIVKTFPGVNAQIVKCGKLNAKSSIWWENHLREVAEAMCSGVFYARPNYRECGRCAFRKDCEPAFCRISSKTYGEFDADGL